MKLTKDLDLNRLSWQVSEREYRDRRSISYSVLSRMSREGFKSLEFLNEVINTQAIRYGSLVDTLLTDKSNFEKQFIVVNNYIPTPQMIDINNEIARRTGYQISKLDEVDDNFILQIAKEFKFGASNWLDATRVLRVREALTEYYSIYVNNMEKYIVNKEDYNDAKTNVDTLNTHKFTSYLFNTQFTNTKTYFQLKFLYEYKGIDCKCMFDIIHVDYENKTIYPIDLKTTGWDETEFNDSFLKWRYDIQATFYYHILKDILSKDKIFKDFKIAPFTFLVINRKNNIPIFWEYEESINFEQKEIIYDNKVLLPWYELIEDTDFALKNNQFTYSHQSIKNNGKNKLKIINR